MRPRWACAAAALVVLPAGTPGAATGLYVGGSWSSLASDRVARQVGDAITILVYESATASNSASSGSNKKSKLDGSIHAGNFDKSAGFGLDGSSDATGSTGRSGQMVAQISAVVDAVLPNGDLEVTGAQELHINNERTHIRVKGRVRAADISQANTVLSSRLADAAIDYDGAGFVSRSARPGIITRLFSWLGLL